MPTSHCFKPTRAGAQQAGEPALQALFEASVNVDIGRAGVCHSAACTRECGWMVGLGAGVTVSGGAGADAWPFSLPGAASSAARLLSVFDADSGLLARVAASTSSPAAPACGVAGARCCCASHALCCASSTLSTLHHGCPCCVALALFASKKAGRIVSGARSASCV